MNLTTNCPSCQGPIIYQTPQGGTAGTCPHCAAQLTLPRITQLQFLGRIQEQSCYTELRATLNGVMVLGVFAGIGAVIYGVMLALNHDFQGVFLAGYGVVLSLSSFLSCKISVVLLDIADTLIDEKANGDPVSPSRPLSMNPSLASASPHL